MFTRQEIASACTEFGPRVAPLPETVDGAQLLFAMSGNESSFGANCTPRHEPAFDVGGVYGNSAAMAPFLAKFPPVGNPLQSPAAFSYGPLQLMFVNAGINALPSDFNDIGKAFAYSVAFLNKLLNRFHPQNLGDIGSCWNEGHIQHPYSPAVQTYVDRLTANYQVPIPVLV